jgi:cell division protein FtsW
LLVISVISLILVILIGTDVNGGKRWIDLGFASVQPSEIAKIAVIIFFASSLSMNYKKLGSFSKGLLPYLLCLGVFAGLIMLEPHFSATCVILFIGCILLIAAGARIKHFLLLSIPALIGAAGMIMAAPYRLQRVTSFLDPFADKLGDGWQIIQSLYAIGSGSIFGLGLGQSRQKFLYIPEPHNDFIFSILCEEMGFIGAVIVLGLFGILIFRGIKIAIHAPDLCSSLLAVGITSLIAIEVIVNVAVVTASMPVTGMPLPFFSYGGTTLLINMIAMGILLSISRLCTLQGSNSKGGKR